MTIPRKRFGQHFLRDQGVIQKIIAALNPKADQHLVEIGPGQGALTIPVLKLVPTLEVVELDRDLVAELRDRAHDKLIIHEGDALTFDFAKLKQDNRLLRIFGNLPYNISTPLLFHLLSYATMIADMTFMLQKEVAQRLAAGPGNKTYGRLSVMVQYYCEVTELFDVAPHSFHPPPKVDSSIILLKPFATLPATVQNEKQFAALVKQAFNQRRKTLRNSLRNSVSDEVWKTIGIDASLRAENLSVKDFVTLSNAINLPKDDL